MIVCEQELLKIAELVRISFGLYEGNFCPPITTGYRYTVFFFMIAADKAALSCGSFDIYLHVIILNLSRQTQARCAATGLKQRG